MIVCAMLWENRWSIFRFLLWCLFFIFIISIIFWNIIKPEMRWEFLMGFYGWVLWFSEISLLSLVILIIYIDGIVVGIVLIWEYLSDAWDALKTKIKIRIKNYREPNWEKDKKEKWLKDFENRVDSKEKLLKEKLLKEKLLKEKLLKDFENRVDSKESKEKWLKDFENRVDSKDKPHRRRKKW